MESLFCTYSIHTQKGTIGACFALITGVCRSLRVLLGPGLLGTEGQSVAQPSGASEH